MKKIFTLIAFFYIMISMAQVSVSDELKIKKSDSTLVTKIRLKNDLITITGLPNWKFKMVSGVPTAFPNGVMVQVFTEPNKINYSKEFCESYIQSQCNGLNDKCSCEKIDNRVVFFERHFSDKEINYYYRFTYVLSNRVINIDWSTKIPLDGKQDEVVAMIDEFAEFLARNAIKISSNHFDKAPVKSVKK
ncbi:hypothetical protein OIU83_09715 [Flavobacterium sp. LS1R49]|uniref:DUF4468 domain-containing protein n=1 Tax=Flavobacterium shii TaxID=2987687 RepID=A0A9X2ZEK2_9FLAO|nr:hypothetical protein [Flavobacterium shii]MCV9927930.1 hypothetical protein [Flavobacterium shii]